MIYTHVQTATAKPSAAPSMGPAVRGCERTRLCPTTSRRVGHAVSCIAQERGDAPRHAPSRRPRPPERRLLPAMLDGPTLWRWTTLGPCGAEPIHETLHGDQKVQRFRQTYPGVLLANILIAMQLAVMLPVKASFD